MAGGISGDGEGRWWEGRFDLAGLSGDVELRLRYATDAVYSGRGVYVDRIQVPGTFDDWDLTDREAVITEGWTRVTADGSPAPTTAADALAGLDVALERHVASGGVAGPVAHQLATAVHQARSQLDRGHEDSATRFLERVLRHLDNPRRTDTLSEDSRSELRGQAVLTLDLLVPAPVAIAGAV